MIADTAHLGFRLPRNRSSSGPLSAVHSEFHHRQMRVCCGERPTEALHALLFWRVLPDILAVHMSGISLYRGRGRILAS